MANTPTLTSTIYTRIIIVAAKSKIIVIAAIAALSYAAPVFAQSFSRSNGTGNELPSYYDHDGGLHFGSVPQESSTQIAVKRGGLNAFAQTRRPTPQERNTQIAVKRGGLNAFAQTRRPTPQELNEFSQGDYYAPSKTVVQHASPREQNAFREGDFYAPTAN